MASENQQFSVDVAGDYIHLKTWGALDTNNLDAPANAALALATERDVHKLLDDIRDIDTSAVSIPMQAKAMGILWKLRKFDKVAIVLQGSRVRTLFFETIENLHLNLDTKFKGFDDESEAIAWLQGQRQ